MDDRSLPAGAFKATCLKATYLKVMDEVAASGHAVFITKRGKPVARLVPVKAVGTGARPSIFGVLAGNVSISGDIEAPLDLDWDPESEWDEGDLAVHGRRRGKT